LETLKLTASILLLLVITLLPQAPGLAGYWFLKRTNQWWAGVVAIGLPPLIFFALVYVFIRHERAVQLPSEYWMVVGFWFLMLDLYLVFGTILNFGFGLVTQLILLKRRQK
jgi:hypothetical protein